MFKRVFALLCALLLALPLAAGAEETNAEEMLSGILDFKAVQSGAVSVSDWAAAQLPALMGKGGEWYVLALSQTGGYNLSACCTALEEYVASAKVRSATTRQKLALTLLALGGEDDFITSTLSDSIGKQGVMSWAWGLHLLNNGCESADCPADEVVKTLLSLRKEDGGWAITGSISDADATAMVLQALAPHRNDAAVAEAVDGAVALLSSRQLPGGGYASYGVENAESAAQVIIALCALGIDPFADARFIKDGATLQDALGAFRLQDGSFSHEKGGEYSESATAQACLALAAYTRFRAGKGSLYLLEKSPVPAESRMAWNYRSIAAAIVGGAALICCIALFIMGKRHPKNFLAVAIMAAVLIGLVLTVDIQSAEEYYSADMTKKDVVGNVTLTIRCDKAAGKAAHIPADGVILAEAELPIAPGDTVYTVLTDAARKYGLHMEASGADGLMYVHGIGNIYEFDFGDLSGWVYLVNGESASVGCDQYVLEPGDKVAFHYTLELGKDID